MPVTVHAYAREPKDRYFSINSKLLREGDFLAPGLRLEQITPDGATFSYKEFRFRRDVR